MTTKKETSGAAVMNLLAAENATGKLVSVESLNFAKALRGWRLARGMTQDELVEKSGVSKSSVSLAERAFHTYPPKSVTQARLAAALGITMSELQAPPTDDNVRAAQAIVVSEPLHGVMRVPGCASCEHDINFVALPEKWILGAVGSGGNNLCCMMVRDQTMLPSLQTGDVAVTEPATGVAQPGIYVVAMAGQDGAPGIMGIRRITPLPGGNLRVTCDNERFSGNDAVYPPSRLQLLSKVVFVARCHIAE